YLPTALRDATADAPGRRRQVAGAVRQVSPVQQPGQQAHADNQPHQEQAHGHSLFPLPPGEGSGEGALPQAHAARNAPSWGRLPAGEGGPGRYPSRVPPIIEVEGLVKRYRKATRNAVDGISFTVEAGELFALLGPNGAGKTTTIAILTTTLAPTA